MKIFDVADNRQKQSKVPLAQHRVTDELSVQRSSCETLPHDSESSMMVVVKGKPKASESETCVSWHRKEEEDARVASQFNFQNLFICNQ